MNIFKICFSDESIEEDKIQEVIDELHLLGSTFWDDAEDFMFFADGTGGYKVKAGCAVSFVLILCSEYFV